MTAGKPGAWTNLTPGAAVETIARNTQNPLATVPATSLVAMILMTTGNGETSPITDTFGFPLTLSPDGRRTVMDIGYGSLPGDGPGSKTNLGGLLHFTTGAGPKWAEAGAGSQVQWWCGLCMLRRWLFSWADRDSARRCHSVAAVASRGSRSARAKYTFRLTARACVTCRT